MPAPKKTRKSSAAARARRVKNAKENLVPSIPILRNTNELLEIEKRARHLARAEIAEMWPRIKSMTVRDILALDTEKLTIVEGIFVKCLQASYHKGDTDEIHRMYDRLLVGSVRGLPNDTVDIGGTTFTVDLMEDDSPPVIDAEVIQSEQQDSELAS